MKFPKPTKKKRRINLLSKPKTLKDLVKELDVVVSLKIRERDNWTCIKCGLVHDVGSSSLTCSHYFKRDLKGTRWDFENLDSLCWNPCHLEVEKAKKGWYRDYMIEKLGENKFELLRMKANAVNRFKIHDIQLLIDIYKS